jgi:hypothetical protein
MLDGKWLQQNQMILLSLQTFLVYRQQEVKKAIEPVANQKEELLKVLDTKYHDEVWKQYHSFAKQIIIEQFVSYSNAPKDVVTDLIMNHFDIEKYLKI